MAQMKPGMLTPQSLQSSTIRPCWIKHLKMVWYVAAMMHCGLKASDWANVKFLIAR